MFVRDTMPIFYFFQLISTPILNENNIIYVWVLVPVCPAVDNTKGTAISYQKNNFFNTSYSHDSAELKAQSYLSFSFRF